jgi:signal transduction histidine kinase
MLSQAGSGNYVAGGRADEAEQRKARLLLVAGLLGTVPAAVTAVEAATVGRPEVAAVAAVFAALSFLGAWFSRTLRLRAAAAVTTLVVVAGSLGVVLLEGPTSVRLGMLLPGIIFMGFALRAWLAFAYAAFLVMVVALAARFGGMVPWFPLLPAQRPVWLDVCLQILVSTGLVVAFTRGFRDLLAHRSERARALELVQRDLSAAQKRLEQLVAVRSGELSRAADDLETFVAVIAHDLKAPLRHLLGFIAWCLDGDGVPPRTRALLGEAQQAALVMAERVEHIVERERQRALKRPRAD